MCVNSEKVPHYAGSERIRAEHFKPINTQDSMKVMPTFDFNLKHPLRLSKIMVEISIKKCILLKLLFPLYVPNSLQEIPPKININNCLKKYLKSIYLTLVEIFSFQT